MNIKTITVVEEESAQEFLNSLNKIVSEFQTTGYIVEIQYSFATKALAGYAIFNKYTALVIGRQ